MTFVKQRLGGHDSAREEVERLEETPDGDAELHYAGRELEQVLREEPELRREVAELLSRALEVPELRRFLIQASGQSRVGKIVQMGDVEGDVRF
ncbi:hypothetical protein [Streptomyces sp. NPDC054863]